MTDVGNDRFSEMKTGRRRNSDAPMADDLSAMIGFVTLSNAKGLLFGAAWAGAWCRRFFALPFEAQGKLRMGIMAKKCWFLS